MCRGTFDGPNEQPRITASLLHISLQIGHELSLIIDTGADSTTLSGIDAVKMGLVPEQLDEMEMEYSEIEVSGVSSTSGYAIKEKARNSSTCSTDANYPRPICPGPAWQT